jgi:hypothetical protein
MKVFRIMIALAISFAVGIFLSKFWKRTAEEPALPQAAVVKESIPTASPLLHSSPLPTAKKIAKSRKGASTNPNHVEFKVIDGLAVAYGDIILGQPEDSELKGGWTEVRTPELWDKPEIPYIIDDSLPHPERVKAAIQYFNSETPVRFILHNGEPDALVFQSGKEHCLSLLGKAGGMQPIRLSDKCGKREIIHEMMHAIGFVHEQSRTDRDTYVEILWPNIEEKYWPQFAVVPDSLMETVKNFPFDYHSIMLYEKNTFAKDKNLASMISKQPEVIQPAEALSEGDKKRLNYLFPN